MVRQPHWLNEHEQTPRDTVYQRYCRTAVHGDANSRMWLSDWTASSRGVKKWNQRRQSKKWTLSIGSLTFLWLGNLGTQSVTPDSKLSPLNGKEVGHPTSILSNCHRTLIDSELLAFPMCHNGGKVDLRVSKKSLTTWKTLSNKMLIMGVGSETWRFRVRG